MAEARGSSPLSSTSSSDEEARKVIGAHEFREHFGYWMDQAAAGVDVVVTRHGEPVVQLSPAEFAQPALTDPVSRGRPLSARRPALDR